MSSRIIRIDPDVSSRIEGRRAELEKAWGRRVSRNEVVRQILGLHVTGPTPARRSRPAEPELPEWIDPDGYGLFPA